MSQHARIHQLTSQHPLASSTVVCGDQTATHATWDLSVVTCPACRPVPSPRRPRPGGMSEKALLAQVTAALTRAGWLFYHTHDARHSPAGFPDLVCLRGTRLLCIECKSATGALTPAQQTWLEAWRRIPGADVQVWRPADLERALAVLR